MAYHGGYGEASGPQRPYASSAAHPPGPRGFNDRPPPTRQYAPRRSQDDYGDGYGHDDRGGGYAQQGQGYGQPRDYYPPGPGGRGGPAARPSTADGRRGDPYPSRARGMDPGSEPARGLPARPHPQNSDHGAGRQPPMANGRPGRHDPAYGMDQDLAGQMSGMALNNGHPAQGDYGRPPMNGNRGPPPRNYPSRGYSDPRPGPPPRQAPNGYGGYGHDYPSGPNGGNPSGDPNPPARSMTAPAHDSDPRHNMPPPPQRTETMPFNGPAGRGGVPPRPSTASGNRPPPRRIYPPESQGLPRNGQGGGYQSAGGYGLPDIDGVPGLARGNSFEQPQRGAHQMPRLHHAKSAANVREPQAAVFEMASDMPAVPPVPQVQPYRPEFGGGYGQSGGYEQMAPPPPRGYSGSDGLSRTGTNMSQNSNPDALPSHPTPVRPGLMANSMQQQQPPPQQRTELERLRMAIKTNAGDQDSALKLARKLIEAADVLAPKMPDAKQRARTRERYLLDAQKILKKLASAQNQDAMFSMADGLGKGLFGHEPDNKEAFTLYQSAAKLGHPAAAYRTAVCCEIGHEEGGGTRKDPLKAMQWYKRAATLGDPPAMYKLGMILLKGLLGQQKNPREAVGWLRRAAERADGENPHALHELGLLYESAQPNDAIIRDERYALSLFQDAAELGYKFSQYRLGCVFEYGLMGCPIDPRQSIFWYSKAAAQEEHQSELALSGWYLTGSEGVLGQSDTEAYLWARKAAVAGLAKAEYAMGYFTEVGIGVPANLEDAKRWYWRAAAQEFPKARERLEDLKRAGKHGRPRPRERISRSRIEKQQEGECSIM
ncbi:sel1 repeat domain-containing protein [Hirsutella rhossiliensis]|uniref:Sel1 repeat domain-containing protein n=1 Tax=Hirsutella rhossiliensis TaxID=111463 RepID=A0A9P8N1T6_9HYPO|nr:sel1 repeat domain-containing protein [Hirsutella rhossiliensis]KAH0964349.1 sel1 repeat domain-containing protein [Hirsutella rhossiliensis]